MRLQSKSDFLPSNMHQLQMCALTYLLSGLSKSNNHNHVWHYTVTTAKQGEAADKFVTVSTKQQPKPCYILHFLGLLIEVLHYIRHLGGARGGVNKLYVINKVINYKLKCSVVSKTAELLQKGT